MNLKNWKPLPVDRIRLEPEWKGEKNGTDNWSFGRSSFGGCDSIFSSANLRKACKIVYVETGHAAGLLGDDNGVVGCHPSMPIIKVVALTSHKPIDNFTGWL